MEADALWYEAANVVGIANAINVVADGFNSIPKALLAPIDDQVAPPAVQALFADIRTFYLCQEIPVPFRVMANDPGYAGDVWAAVKRAFEDHCLARRLK